MNAIIEGLSEFALTFLHTITDVLPIAAIIFAFQVFILRAKIPNLKRVLIGFFYVIIGLALFLQALEDALFPIGKLMAAQLTDPNFILHSATELKHNIEIHWSQSYWVYIFALTIGFSTTIAEPSLLGVALGISQGSWRIVTGLPLHWFIITGYIIVVIRTFYSPKLIISLAYDFGGVTTSTVTVPLVAALGIGLAAKVPGRSELLDGFGLIAFASLFPIISVLAYAQLSEWYCKRKNTTDDDMYNYDSGKK